MDTLSHLATAWDIQQHTAEPERGEEIVGEEKREGDRGQSRR